MRLRFRPRLLAVGAVCVVVVAAAVSFLFWWRGQMAVPASEELRVAVRNNPPVPIVFTSRSSAASFTAAAPEAEGFQYPGTIPWAATEGRLRLLKPDGSVYELTWNRPLPDGGTLIDVMGPSVSLDGCSILFAGRRAPPDAGRWRIYRMDVDGRNYQQVTGGPEDPGCVRLPPLRYAADGSRLEDEARRRLDYDDVDPVDLGHGRMGFASSRLPDLGRGHTRRATQLWVLPAGQPVPRPLTANRNNDRWPWLTKGEDLILFSMWSRNREVVDENGELRPDVPSDDAVPAVTSPTDSWLGMHVKANGDQFGYAAKLRIPVWRPRTLYNGRIVFMTEQDGRFRLAQAELGSLQIGGSSLARSTPMPRQQGGDPVFAPDHDQNGHPVSSGCPSPCPGGTVLFSAGAVGGATGGYGLYRLPQEWFPTLFPEPLFDDPELADAEPVAVCARRFEVANVEPPVLPSNVPVGPLSLLGGRTHNGATGELHNGSVNRQLIEPFPGYYTDTGTSATVGYPTKVAAVAVYGAQRDRFDDPVEPRVVGKWEKLLVSPMLPGAQGFRTRVPADPLLPTVLAGLDSEGKVLSWTGGADSTGHAARFYAVAGDHYSGTRLNGYHFCLGCHTGHTHIPADLTEPNP